MKRVYRNFTLKLSYWEIHFIKNLLLKNNTSTIDNKNLHEHLFKILNCECRSCLRLVRDN